jgi:hypothetical protein
MKGEGYPVKLRKYLHSLSNQRKGANTQRMQTIFFAPFR